MNGSTENTAHDASEKPSRREPVFNLATTSKMLPLVRCIVADILAGRQRLSQLLPEQTRLDREKRLLAWPQHSRRYQLQEEIAALDRQVQGALAELASLGVTLFDRAEGRIGFPTLVNRRRAFFSWRVGEETVQYWHFPEDTGNRRPIPASWFKDADITLSAIG
jgi:hypothetical protein